MKHMLLKKKIASNLLVYFLLILLSIGFLMPMFWTFVTSLKIPKDAFSLPPKWFNFKVNIHNYPNAWHSKDFAKSFFNTIIIGLVSVIITVVLSIPASYALSRFKIKFSNIITSSLLGIRIIPEVMFIIPLFIIFNKIHLYDTLTGMILVFQIYNLPFSILVLRSFVSQVPKEMEESAAVDGASQSYVLLRIVVPLLSPGIASVSVLSIIRVWVELLFPLALTYHNSPTISIAIANFKGYGSFNLSLMCAGAIIATIPQVLFIIFAQKYIVQGLTLGAVKG